VSEDNKELENAIEELRRECFYCGHPFGDHECFGEILCEKCSELIVKCKWCEKELSKERIIQQIGIWKVIKFIPGTINHFICRKCNEEYNTHWTDHGLPLLEKYFQEKLFKYDKLAANYILKEDTDPWKRYKSLWTTPVHKIWIKGRKYAFFIECVWGGGTLCKKCERPLKFNNFVFHHPYYDFEHVFSTGELVCKQCNKKGTKW